MKVKISKSRPLTTKVSYPREGVKSKLPPTGTKKNQDSPLTILVLSVLIAAIVVTYLLVPLL